MSSSEDFRSFLRQIPADTPGFRVGRLAMSYLMRRQYGRRKPDPCPCYDPG